MSRSDRLIILCAPLTVTVEWLAIFFASWRFSLDFNEPLSALPYNYPDAAWFYGMSVSIAAVLFAIFCLALRQYWKPAFLFALISSSLFLIAAWAQYNPVGGFWNAVHDICASLATLGYSFILFQASFRATGRLRRGGMIFSSIAIVNILAVLVFAHIFRVYVTWLQILLILNVQAWALYFAYHLWLQWPAIQLPDASLPTHTPKAPVQDLGRARHQGS